jgi:hypothetical protein
MEVDAGTLIHPPNPTWIWIVGVIDPGKAQVVDLEDPADHDHDDHDDHDHDDRDRDLANVID